ncbi:MAG TPA: corrinoid protein [Anaerovoracaceae bacterium]|nr:corrinoid protein [Anaerovoracaceae bacterium]
MDLNQISVLIQEGNALEVQKLVEEALDKKIAAKDILNEGLLSGMEIVGKKFKNNEVFVPEVLIAARAMNAGMKILAPALAEAGNESLGKVILGTIKGDLHDIGKNLVGIMLKGVGLDVIDLGVNVSAKEFVDKAEEVGADIIAMSALLTTTMFNMKTVIEELERRDIRDKYLVMVGGAPIDNKLAEEIGADLYAKDASTAGDMAKSALKNIQTTLS